MGKLEYISEWLIYGFVTLIWYKNCIFRCLWNYTYAQSRWILFGMMLASFLLAGYLWRRNRTLWTVFASLLLPYGAYTMMSYRTILGRQIFWIFVITVLCGTVYIAALLLRPVRDEQKRDQIMCIRRNRCLTSAFSFMAAGMLVFLAPLIIQSFTDVTIFRSSLKAYEDGEEKYTLENQVETLLVFQEEKWKLLTVQERLDMLQIVANVEANNLGIPNDVNVAASAMDEHTVAAYNDSAHTINFNLDYLEQMPPRDILNACCHEVYHCYQHRLVDAYRGVDEQMRGLKIFSKAVEYEKEFARYVEGEEDFYTYYGQLCESDARSYAANAVEAYMMALDEELLLNER